MKKFINLIWYKSHFTHLIRQNYFPHRVTMIRFTHYLLSSLHLRIVRTNDLMTRLECNHRVMFKELAPLFFCLLLLLVLPLCLYGGLQEAERAIQCLNGKLALSKKLVVRWAHAQVRVSVKPLILQHFQTRELTKVTVVTARSLTNGLACPNVLLMLFIWQ